MPATRSATLAPCEDLIAENQSRAGHRWYVAEVPHCLAITPPLVPATLRRRHRSVQILTASPVRRRKEEDEMRKFLLASVATLGTGGMGARHSRRHHRADRRADPRASRPIRRRRPDGLCQ